MMIARKIEMDMGMKYKSAIDGAGVDAGGVVAAGSDA